MHIPGIIPGSEVLAHCNPEILAEGFHVPLLHKPAVACPYKSICNPEFLTGDLMREFPVIAEDHFFIKSSE